MLCMQNVQTLQPTVCSPAVELCIQLDALQPLTNLGRQVTTCR